MIGKNSETINLVITNSRNPKKSFEVIVQANKNLGICDVFLPFHPKKPYLNGTDEKSLAKYNELKSAYDEKVKKIASLRSYIINEYQGRQVNNPNVIEDLSETLYYILN